MTQLNYADAEDAILIGSAQVEEFVGEFVGQWFAPLMEMVARAIWEEIPDDVRAQLDPELVKRAEEALAI